MIDADCDSINQRENIDIALLINTSTISWAISGSVLRIHSACWTSNSRPNTAPFYVCSHFIQTRIQNLVKVFVPSDRENNRINGEEQKLSVCIWSDIHKLHLQCFCLLRRFFVRSVWVDKLEQQETSPGPAWLYLNRLGPCSAVMTTSCHESALHITAPSWGESPGGRWIHRPKQWGAMMIFFA